jgi:heme exporter protein A
MKLIVNKLSVLRGGRAILAELSFAVAAGQSLMLTGPNGAGKTTLVRTLAGLIAPAAGHMRLEGGGPDASIGELAHYVGHLNAVKWNLTVAENAGFWAGFLGAGRPVEAALVAFGLAGLADIPAGYLSAGQKRRLALARLLLAPRPIWLLDEPAVSLDRDAQAALRTAVVAQLGTGGLVIAATHQVLGWPNERELALQPTVRQA